jgi:hypothetical protein
MGRQETSGRQAEQGQRDRKEAEMVEQQYGKESRKDDLGQQHSGRGPGDHGGKLAR